MKVVVEHSLENDKKTVNIGIAQLDCAMAYS